jgi:hypothetical protein
MYESTVNNKYMYSKKTFNNALLIWASLMTTLVVGHLIF